MKIFSQKFCGLEINCYICLTEQQDKKLDIMKKYSVWVGGIEVNDFYLSKKDAEKLKKEYEQDGYDDVVIRREVA